MNGYHDRAPHFNVMCVRVYMYTCLCVYVLYYMCV